MMKLLIIFVCLVSVLYAEEQKVVHFFPVNWKQCDIEKYPTSRRSTSLDANIVDPLYKVSLLEFSSTPLLVSRKDSIIFRIKAKNELNKLQAPMLRVTVMMETGMKHYMYNLCTHLKEGSCPIQPHAENVYEITQYIPSLLPHSAIGVDLDVIAEIEVRGEIIECVQFQMKIKA